MKMKYVCLLLLLWAIFLPLPDAAAVPETWRLTGVMNAERDGHTSTLLPDGRVLIAGGRLGAMVALSSAEIYDPATETFTSTGSMMEPRFYHTATLLGTGKVLIVGGLPAPAPLSGLYSTAELYDPVAGTFSYTTHPLNYVTNNAHTATRLLDGTVLIAGVLNVNYAERFATTYDPVCDCFTETDMLNINRIDHAASLLPSGKVLISGGASAAPYAAVASAELYDPVSRTFSYTAGPMSIARVDHRSVLLGSGNVLIVGGVEFLGGMPAPGFVYQAELYDPLTDTFSTTGLLSYNHVWGTATLLNNSKVLMAGGYLFPGGYMFPGGSPESGSELYDPSTGLFTNTGSMVAGHAMHAATLLPSGLVLATGGGSDATNVAELYEPTPAVDLVVKSVDYVISPALPGFPMRFAVTIENRGSNMAVDSFFDVFFDVNVNLDGPLHCTIGAIAAGGTSVCTFEVPYPNNMIGSFFDVFVEIDQDNRIPETNENNNNLRLAINNTPDLVIQSINHSAAATPEQIIPIEIVSMNLTGGVAAGSSESALYFSLNNTLDGLDTYLGSASIGNLAPGGTAVSIINVTIPAVAAGSYYVIAVADNGSTVSEGNELNNNLTSTIKISLPDLVVPVLTAPASSKSGAVIMITDKTKNQGKASASASVTAYYLSKNAVLDATDVYLDARPVPVLAPGAMHSGGTSVTIPDTTTPGNYFIIAAADDDKLVLESNENNNTASKKIVIKKGVRAKKPDFVVSALSATGLGNIFTVTDTTRNKGLGKAKKASVTKYYLSKDSALEPKKDTYLGFRTVPALAAGALSTGTAVVTIPAGMKGKFFIIAAADDTKLIPESSETNNKRSFRIHVMPDLVVPVLTVPESAQRGTDILINETTLNQGSLTTGVPSNTGYFLSVDNKWDALDIPFGGRFVPVLAAGASSVSPGLNFTLPIDIADGQYFIIGRADAGRVVAESNELNNDRAAAITILP